MAQEAKTSSGGRDKFPYGFQRDIGRQKLSFIISHASHLVTVVITVEDLAGGGGDGLLQYR